MSLLSDLVPNRFYLRRGIHVVAGIDFHHVLRRIHLVVICILLEDFFNLKVGSILGRNGCLFQIAGRPNH